MASWEDDSIRVRMFKAALGICKHYSDAISNEPIDQEAMEHFETLCKRWGFIDGADLSLKQCLAEMQKQLIPEAADSVFAQLSTRLSEKFDPNARLTAINKVALQQAKDCIQAWGGKEALARVKSLKLLPLKCESTNKDGTELYFNRGRNPSISIRAGHPSTMLKDCMVLEFSLFHEYLSHAFPNWEADESAISEQWLLALEMDWFEKKYMVFDSTLLSDVWDSRTGHAFKAAQWFLKRCSNECVHKFLLEWVATWRSNAEETNVDLLAQFKGVAKKTAIAFGNAPSAKQKGTLDLLHELLCGPCERGKWDHRAMRDRLAEELTRYGAPP